MCWTIRITSFGSKSEQPYKSEKRSRKTCFQQWALTVFDCSFFFFFQVELEREGLFCTSYLKLVLGRRRRCRAVAAVGLCCRQEGRQLEMGHPVEEGNASGNGSLVDAPPHPP